MPVLTRIDRAEPVGKAGSERETRVYDPVKSRSVNNHNSDANALALDAMSVNAEAHSQNLRRIDGVGVDLNMEKAFYSVCSVWF